MFKTLEAAADFLTSDDLVTLGLYKSRNSIYFARSKGIGPDFIKLGRRILYPKNSVLAFVELHMQKGSTLNDLIRNQ